MTTCEIYFQGQAGNQEGYIIYTIYSITCSITTCLYKSSHPLPVIVFPVLSPNKLQPGADSVLQLRAGALKPQPSCEPIANLIHFFGDRVMTNPATKLSHSKTASSYIHQ